MSLNIGVADVELNDDMTLDILVGVSATGFSPPLSYTGAVSTADVPDPGATEIYGEVSPGAGEEHLVTLPTGYSEDDLPAEVLVTAALDDGTQEQVRVEIDQKGEMPTDPGDDDGLSARDVALAVAGVGGAAFAAQRFLRR